MREYRAAVDQRGHALNGWDDVVAKYVGPWQMRGQNASGGEGYAPDNAYFEYISLLPEELVADNPRVVVGTRREEQSETAEAIQHALNRWVRDVRLVETLQQVAVDFCFRYGVVAIKEEARKGLTLPVHPELQDVSEPMWPVVDRISPKRYFQDSGATRREDLRFQGHEWRADKEDLLERAKTEEGWNIEAIEALSERGHAFDNEQDKETVPFRGEVHCFNIWFPEIELKDSPGADKGFHGTLCTLAIDKSYEDVKGDPDARDRSGHIREPRPFYGPKTGPYTLFGAYYVPDSAYPLAPLAATEEQIRDLNSQSNAVSVSMANHKRVVGCPDAKTANIVKNSGHDTAVVIPFEQGRAMVQEIVVGGETKEQMQYILEARQRLDRILGVDDARRGAVTGEGTATEHAIANESASKRIEYLKSQFRSAASDVLLGAAEYMARNENVVFPLGSQSPEGMPNAIFRGGMDADEGGPEDLELEIDMYSMGRSNQGLRSKQSMEAFQLLTTSLPMMAQFPMAPWRELFDKLGDGMNIPDLGKLFPEDMLAQMNAQMMAQEQIGNAQSPGESRLGSQGGALPGPGAMPGMGTEMQSPGDLLAALQQGAVAM